MLLVVMGVSGSGKSTLAALLAQQLNWPMAEADAYHSEANKAKMAAGIPLNDEDRRPWLDTLHSLLAAWQAEGSSGVMTCSALKETYRARLCEGLTDIKFVWLDPPREAIAGRLAHRTGHYMNPALLDSQIATLEPPSGPGVLHLSGVHTPAEQAEAVRAWILSPALPQPHPVN